MVILFGGKSAEHEVSLRSAKNIVEAMDKKKYNPVLIGIDKGGKWIWGGKSRALLGAKAIERSREDIVSERVALVPESEGKVSRLSHPETQESIDVVFPVLHGPFGEDGTVQGLLKLANIPFVGAGVLGSAVGMDKDVMKRLLRDAGIPIANFLVFRDSEKTDYAYMVKKLGLPFFLKPANLGSSVGVHKVHNEKEFQQALKDAFRYDTKIIIEEHISGREIECSVLGNEHPVASVPGEVVVKHEFYSYEAKYIDENGAALEIPAKLPGKITERVKKLAVETFKVLGCEGMGRVDFFVKKNGAVLVNEINTIPGFTSISMYPQLWKAGGVSYSELIDRLIMLAMERFEKEQKLRTSFGKN